MKKIGISRVLVAIVSMALGCATARYGADDRTAVMAVVGNWERAMESHDIDLLMSCYSDSYVSYEQGPKERMGEFWKKAMDSGYLEKLAIDASCAEVTFDGDRALVWPVVWRGAGPDHSLEFTLEKENGAWRIVVTDGL